MNSKRRREIATGSRWQSKHSRLDNSDTFKQSSIDLLFFLLGKFVVGLSGCCCYCRLSGMLFCERVFAVQKSGDEDPVAKRCSRNCTGMNDSSNFANQSPAFTQRSVKVERTILIGTRERCCTSSPRGRASAWPKIFGCVLLGMLRTKTPLSIVC